MRRSPSRALALAAGVVAMLSITPSAAHAQQESADEVYADAFGAGMRAWAESHYHDAVVHLSRAYALRPSLAPLKLIVRSYDLMGNCGAAAKHLQLMRDEYPSDEAPKLQRCATPATLVLACELSDEALIQVGRDIIAHCGESVSLAAGKWSVTVPSHDLSEEVELREGQRRRLRFEIRPRKWPSASVEALPPEYRRGIRVPALVPNGGTSVPIVGRAAVPALTPGQRAQVPALTPDGVSRYTVYLSDDGLYQIWVPGDGPELLKPYEKKKGAKAKKSGKGKK